MNRYLIIADDITGSNDTGLQLKRRGIQTVVNLDAASIGNLHSSYVLNTESRALTGDEAFDLIKKLLLNIDMTAYDHVIKKVDSTLRGPIAHEVAAVDAVYKPELIVFMPALPDLGRTTENGIHKLNGTRITHTEFARDPITPVVYDNVNELLAIVFNEPVIHVEADAGGEINFAAGRIFAFDCITNAHMRTIIAQAIKTGKKILWVGSAGLVDNLLEIESPQNPAIALVASLSQTSRDQVIYAEEKGICVMTVPSSEILENSKQQINHTVMKASAILKNKQDLILAPAASYNYIGPEKENELAKSKGIDRTQVSGLVQKYMSVIMAGILEQSKVSGVFATGGDATIGFLKEISATGLQIESEVLIGIPLTRIVGGKHDGLRLITKAGAFGQKDALYFALRKLKEI